MKRFTEKEVEVNAIGKTKHISKYSASEEHVVSLLCLLRGRARLYLLHILPSTTTYRPLSYQFQLQDAGGHINTCGIDLLCIII